MIYGLLVLASTTNPKCDPIKGIYQQQSCCPSSPSPTALDICWLDRVNFPHVKGDPARYVYGGGVLGDATEVFVYATDGADSLLAPNAFNAPQAKLNNRDPNVLSVLRKHPSTVSYDDVKDIVTPGTIFMTDFSNGYAAKFDKISYKMRIKKDGLDGSTFPPEEFWVTREGWFDPDQGTQSLFFICDEIGTVLPEYDGPDTNVKVGVPMSGSQKLDDIPEIVELASYPVIYAPAGSGLVPGQSYTLSQLAEGKRYAKLVQHAAWCPTCAAAVIGPNPTLGVTDGSAHSDFHQFMIANDMHADLAEIIVFTPEPMVVSYANYLKPYFENNNLTHLIGLPDTPESNAFIAEQIFMKHFGFSAEGAAGFARLTVTANRTHSEVFGAVWAPPEYNYLDRLGVNGDGIITWEWYAQKFPNAIIVKAPFYGSGACPVGCNSMLKVVDLQQDVVKIGKAPLYIFHDWMTGVPVKENFLKTIGHLDKAEALDIMPQTYPPMPTTAYSPVDTVLHGAPSYLEPLLEVSRPFTEIEWKFDMGTSPTFAVSKGETVCFAWNEPPFVHTITEVTKTQYETCAVEAMAPDCASGSNAFPPLTPAPSPAAKKCYTWYDAGEHYFTCPMNFHVGFTMFFGSNYTAAVTAVPDMGAFTEDQYLNDVCAVVAGSAHCTSGMKAKVVVA